MKQFLKKVVPFSISFLLGIFIASFFKSTEISINLRQNPNSEIKSTFFNPPKEMECDHRTRLERLIEKKNELNEWLKNNEGVPKKILKAKLKELEELNIQINSAKLMEDLEKQAARDDGVSSDLLYRCRESKWKNPRREN